MARLESGTAMQKNPDQIPPTGKDGAISDTLPSPDIPLATTPDLEPESPVTASSPANRTRSANRPSILAPVAGGALAAIAGFGLSYFDAFGLQTASNPADLVTAQQQASQDLVALKSEMAAQGADLAKRIAAIGSDVAAIAAPPDLTAIDAKLAALDDRLATIEALPVGDAASNATLAAKLSELERQLAELGTGNGLSAETAAKVDGALQRLADAEAGAATNAAKAADLIETTRRADAVDKLKLAVASGAAYGEQLGAMTGIEVPAAIADHAETGVITLATLQESFADAARSALLAAHSTDPETGWGQRMLNFLKAQTGARPLTPQDGTDPEAVLSRAEAAVRAGSLPDALAELVNLDPTTAAPLADWIAKARDHQAVEDALSTLALNAVGQGE